VVSHPLPGAALEALVFWAVANVTLRSKPQKQAAVVLGGLRSAVVQMIR